MHQGLQWIVNSVSYLEKQGAGASVQEADRILMEKLLGHLDGSPQIDSHEPLLHVHGRQHHLHLPDYDNGYFGHFQECWRVHV